jgi:phosphate transport system substrate-binding protein
MKTFRLLIGAVVIGSVMIGCSPASSTSEGTTGTTTASTGDQKITGQISIDGSSTVYPIAQLLTEMYSDVNGEVKVGVSESGTGSGMKKFVAGEIDIATASRPIEAEEIADAKKNGIDFVEIPVAFDGLSVVINKSNTMLDNITTAELKKLWEPDSKVKTWADLRAGLPAEKINLFGPGDKSGTFEYFTEVVVGKKRASRQDYQPSEDDNVLVTGIAGDKNALGYFGYGYYQENQDKLTVLKVDGVAPSKESILDGSYGKLARPLFVYVSMKAMARPEVKQFVETMMTNLEKAPGETGYVALPTELLDKAKARVTAGTTGSVFSAAAPGAKMADILK